jgi:LCP family protein required for cell wall assembly
VDDAGAEVTVRSRRRRDAAASGGLSVADLLARHGVEGGSGQSVSSHRLRDDSDPEIGTVGSTNGAERHPRRPLGDGYDRSSELPEDEQGHTQRLFPNGTIEPDSIETASLLTVLDQIGLLAVTEYDQPTEKTKPVTPPEPAALFFQPPDDTDAPTEVILGALEYGRFGDIESGHTVEFKRPGSDVHIEAPEGDTRADERDGDVHVEEPDGDAHVKRPDTGAPAVEPDRDAHTGEPDAGADAGEPVVPGVEDGRSKGSVADRTAHIDQTLSRLSAIHAGLTDDVTDRVGWASRLSVIRPGGGRRSKDRPRDEHDEPTGAEEHSPTRASRFRPHGRARIVGLAVVAALLVVGIGAGGDLWLNGKLRDVAALDPTAPGVINAAAQVGDQNYLIVASDPSDTQAPESNASDRVETVLLAHVPANRARVVLLSAPATLVVDRPGCDRYDGASASYPGGSVPAQSGVPLASSYLYGGPKCVVTQMQLLTGLAINHFISLNLVAVRAMVDAENGLSMCVAAPVLDDTLGAVVPNAGRQVLGGDVALAYARAWHVKGEPKDGSGQALRQQLLLAALLNKASSSPLPHIPTLTSVVNVLAANSLVDGVRLGQLSALAAALRGTDPTKVDFVGVPTAGQLDTQGNQVISTDAAKTLFDAIRTNKALPGEGATSPEPSTADAANTVGSTLPPSAVTVTVRNGSLRSGLANDAASSLRGLGFQVAGVGDATRQASGRTVIQASADQTDQAAALAQAVPDATVQTVSGTNILELVLGDSFDGQIAAAPSAVPAGPPLHTSAQLSCK